MAQATCPRCKGTGRDKSEVHGHEFECTSCSGTGETGCLNPDADRALENANKTTWSDTNLTGSNFGSVASLVCTCGNDTFQVVATGSYETSARCTLCKKWYIVHSG